MSPNAEGARATSDSKANKGNVNNNESNVANNGVGPFAHHLDCTSSMSAMEYDPRCPRCGKIKTVIALRRKGLSLKYQLSKNDIVFDEEGKRNEAELADVMANRLVTQYKLTRGECYDREYSAEIIQAVQYARTYAAERLKPKRFVRKANIDA